MHWILRILREIARRIRLHRRKLARRSHRNGQLDPSAQRRKILIANNIRQSGWKNTDFGSEKGMNAERNGISASHYRARNVDGRPTLTLTFVFLSFYWPFISTVFHSFPPCSPSLLPMEMDMFSSDQTPRSLIPPSAERMRRPDITMLPLTRANNDAVKSIPTQ